MERARETEREREGEKEEINFFSVAMAFGSILLHKWLCNDIHAYILRKMAIEKTRFNLV